NGHGESIEPIPANLAANGQHPVPATVADSQRAPWAPTRPQPSVAEYLHPVRVDGLRLLPSGPLPPAPPELLGSPRLESLLAALGQEADIVILDSPPTLAVADTIVLADSV